MIIKAADYNVTPNCPIEKQLSDLFRHLAEIDGEKTLVFDAGDYFIDMKNSKSEMLYITNTVGDREFKKHETPHNGKVALNLKSIKNLKIEGNGAKFIIKNGKATNAVIQNCENIEINDIEIDVEKPDIQELRVISIGRHHVDFELDKNTEYEFRNGKLYFTGPDYDVNVIKKYKVAYNLGCVKKATPNKIERVHYIFLQALKAKDLGNRKIRIYYINTRNFTVDDRYYTYGSRRQNVGIFVDASKNRTLNNVAQHFNYSLAFVAQDTENRTLNKLDFSPDKKTGRLVTSIADFIQICMCRGRITIKNSNFEGAGDDCLNVHGVHFKIKKVSGNTIIVRFMHPQSHNYNAIHSGDKIAFINSETLLESGTATVASSKLINEYELELQLDNAENARVGEVIENISACPELEFRNNIVNRIITRGLLITNRKKVIVDGNHFISNTMSGILLSDDASSWYESGMCKDVTISNNVFDYCGEAGILIKPENRTHQAAVHENIKILNNEFKGYNGACINAKSTKNLVIKGNTFANDDKLKTSNCEQIETDF